MELKAVKTVSTEMVEPAEETDKTKYELSGFDRLMRYAPYQKRILFYKEHASDLSDLVTNLKRSLARVLVAFPPLAGRMRCGDGISSPVLEIDCTGELGVQFTEAETDTTIEQLGECEPSEFCDSLCDVGNPPPQHPWKGNLSLIFVQATKFGCGGLTVGVAFSHQAMDGISAWRFINSWAEVARTGTSSIFKTAQQFYGFKHLTLSDKEFFEAAAGAGLKKRDDVDELPEGSFGGEKPEVRTKLYKMDKFAIEKLKEEAGVSKEGRKFSTYVVLCAHLWRKVTVARSLTSMSNFLVLVNARDKIKLVPHTYFGNAITSCFITATVEELVEKPLSHAASLLHEAIRDFDSDKAVNALAFYDKCVESGQKLLKRFVTDPMTMVVSSPKHPVYENDFGFGRPIGATFGANDLHEGKLYLFPSADGAGVDATVVLPPDSLQRLLNDPSVVV